MKNGTDDCSLFRSCHLADAISSPVLKIHAMARSLQTKKSNRNEKRDQFSGFNFIFRFAIDSLKIGDALPCDSGSGAI